MPAPRGSPAPCWLGLRLELLLVCGVRFVFPALQKEDVLWGGIQRCLFPPPLRLEHQMRLMLLAASEFSWKGQSLGRERVKGKSSGGGSGEGWPELP